MYVHTYMHLLSFTSYGDWPRGELRKTKYSVNNRDTYSILEAKFRSILGLEGFTPM